MIILIIGMIFIGLLGLSFVSVLLDDVINGKCRAEVHLNKIEWEVLSGKIK